MTYDELKAALMKFFGDTSRSASETREGLLAIAEEAEALAESIPESE